MKTYSFREKVVEFPQSIDELTPEQYVYYIVLASMLTGGGMTLKDWRARWFSYLAGMKRSNYTILRPEYIRQAEGIIGEITDRFLTDRRGTPSPTFDTCRNLLPEINGHRGPDDWLNGLEFGKFVKCATLLEHVEPSSDATAYEEIARTLYTIPEGEAVPPVLTWHAPVLFNNVCHAIQSGPIDINGRMIDLSIIFKGSGGRKPDDKTGWAGVSFEVAAAGVFGNIHELDRSDFWAVLLYLYRCKFEYNHEKKK